MLSTQLTETNPISMVVCDHRQTCQSALCRLRLNDWFHVVLLPSLAFRRIYDDVKTTSKCSLTSTNGLLTAQKFACDNEIARTQADAAKRGGHDWIGCHSTMACFLLGNTSAAVVLAASLLIVTAKRPDRSPASGDVEVKLFIIYH